LVCNNSIGSRPFRWLVPNQFITPYTSQFSRLLAIKVGQVRFTKEHEWVKLHTGSIASIGITDHAQHELGDVVFIELPELGTKLKKGEAFGTVESVKATSSVYAPVNCEVSERNNKLLADNSLINKSAEGDGWMLKVKLTKPEELDSLMDATAYKKHVAESKH